MKRTFLSLFLLLMAIPGFTQSISGNKVFEMMHNRYKGKWHRNVTFVQQTEQFNEGKLSSTQTWYEAIQYPDQFRLDIGDTKSGNLIIVTRDSIFKYQNHSRIYAGHDFSDLIFLSGGMYFYPIAKAKDKLKFHKYDLSKAFETKWAGRPVYVIGAKSATENVSQLWIDKERLILLRAIQYDNGGKMEFVFDGHKNMGTSWVESKVTIYMDGQKVQVETYKDIKINQQLDSKLFDPRRYDKAKHWYK